MPSKRCVRALALALLLVVVGAGGWAEVRAGQPGVDADEPMRTVSVSGTGEVRVVPDTATVQLGVQTEAESAAEALTQNSQQMGALIDALQEAGISPNDLQTQVVQLQPQRAQQVEPREGLGEIIGYLATNILEVRVTNLQNLGAIIDAAVQAGGNTVQGVLFRVSDPGDAVTRARQLAMEDATLAAQQLATLSGAQLGEVVTITEARRAPVPVDRVAAPEVVAVPIAPGTESVFVTVSVTWLLR